jgi:DNA ligase-1
MGKIFPTLYKQAKKGEIREWRIQTNGGDIMTTHGMHGGAMQLAVKEAKAKNVGRANETTAEQQAKLEAESMWKKKKDKGYFESVKEAEEEVVFLPMLAHELKPKVLEKLEFPVDVQPKLDGVRCLAHWKGDSVHLMSRGGKTYDVAHISKALESILQPNWVLDGEIYLYGLPLQDINKLVKKHRDKPIKDIGYCSTDLEYWVYDTFCTEGDYLQTRHWSARLRTLKMGTSIPSSGSIKRIPTHQVESRQELMAAHQTFNTEGYEGTIIRLHNGLYELGHRSRSLLKYKDFQDDEFEIVGFDEGVGKFVGCVVWVCRTKSGREFRVVPKGTMRQKQEWFQAADKYISQMLTVKYQTLTKDGIPEFPVGITIRMPEDM